MKKLKPTGRAGGGTYTVLDVGSAKVACFIAEMDAGGAIRIKGVGHQLSKGIRASTLTDVQDAETSIIAAVHAAEQMAGETVENVVVSLAGGALESRSMVVEMQLLGESVSERDILDIIEQGRASAEQDGVEIIHTFPVSYTLDSTKGIQDPRQMFGERLGAELHMVTQGASITRNLSHCVARAHLNVEEFVLASHASALACLEPDEMELGVMLLDMGAGASGFSIFSGGKNVYSDVIPVGGMHVTNDIAKGLSTTLAHAERLKTLHGSCISTPNDDHVMISAPMLGEDAESDEGNVMPRSMLVGIIRPRMEEVFEMIRGRLEASGMESSAGRRVVLTGGASQLIGVRELASRVLGRQVRLAKPKPIPGLADAVSGPAFSASLGMLRFVTNKPMEDRLLHSARARGGMGARLKAMAGWFRESF